MSEQGKLPAPCGGADLHTHSTFSDGTLTPTELIALAGEVGLDAVVLCDHNTVAGLPEFLDAAAGSGIEAVPGTEFSTEYRGAELHVLGLFIRPDRFAAVRSRLAELLVRKEAGNIDLCRALRRAGVALDYGEIKAGTPNGQVNRAVIAAHMVRLGYCGSVKEAFDRWLSPSRGYYRPPERPDVFETIRFIKSIGAAAVLAHPFLNLREGELRDFLGPAMDAGLDGMETVYPKFDRETARLAGELAEEFGLLSSGGSDFHGANKPDTPLGCARVPMEALRALANRRKTGG